MKEWIRSKASNESSNTEPGHKIEVNNKENFNTNLNQDKLVLTNELNDWQSRQNNVIVYNIPETDFVNSNNTTTNLLSKFDQLTADVCEMTYHKKDITSVYCLGKKSDDNSRIRPILVKFSNRSIKANLIRNAFNLKDSIFSISIDRPKEKRNAFKKLLKENKEHEQKDM